MRIDTDEVLRFLGIRGAVPPETLQTVSETAAQLEAALTPRYRWRLFPLKRETDGIRLDGSAVVLTGSLAASMLADCQRAALLACTLGPRFDALLRREQARDMGRAVILDACGGVYVETGCDACEAEIRARMPEAFLTDRFSPGYGDLPLNLQSAILDALDAPRRLGLTVTESCLMTPMKSVTAVAGLADTPQGAKIRGCAFCALRETCSMRKGGKTCGI